MRRSGAAILELTDVFDQWIPLATTINPLTLLMIMGVCIGASALSGMSGFGAGLIITLFVTPIIGAKAVVPVLAVTMAITNVSRIWFFRSALDWRLVTTIAGPGLLAAVAGSLLYVRLDTAAVQTLLGAVLILSIPLKRYLAGRAIVPSDTVLAGFGGIFGFLSSIMVGAGILLIPMLLGAGLAGSALLATDATIAVAINLVKILMFGTLDALTLQLLVIALAMGICTVPGTWLASWIIKRTDIRIHTLAIEIMIVCGGAVMLITSLW